MTKYAISDLHGRKDLWLKANKEVFKEDDVIYFLGDAADRGFDGWELIKILLDDPRVTYIKGNHEDMFIAAAEKPLLNLRLLELNGGMGTYSDYLSDTEENRNNYVALLKELPVLAIIQNKQGQVINLSHAGYTPIYNPTEEDLLWDREHLYHEWPENENSIVVHGHTPVQYLTQGKTEIVQYANGHKYDIDLGAFASNKLGILNLETFEEIVVSLEE